MALRNEDLETYVSEEDWEMLVDESSPWSIDLSICLSAIISLLLLPYRRRRNEKRQRGWHAQYLVVLRSLDWMSQLFQI
jgi:hypothetical protein